MKNLAAQLNRITSSIVFLVCALLLSGNLLAQVEDAQPEKDSRPVKNTFESIWLIENQTVMVPFKGTFEMDIQHRFGLVENGWEDLFGIYAPSNIRLGFNYVPIDKLQIGFGFTKERLLWDFNLKYALIQQNRSGGWPVSVTYLGNMAVDTRDKTKFIESVDRYSYYHQLMIARKIDKVLSLQVSANLSHFNFPAELYDVNQEFLGRMNNDHLSLSFLGRFKISGGLGIIFNYDLPLTNHSIAELDPEPNLSFGIEVTTSSHAFQIFLSNYQNIVPQLNSSTNRNSFGDSEFALGFNITRLWNF
jgi:hypothetical protein